MYLALLILASVACGAGGGPAPEIEAKYWFNNPVYRLHDDRDVLVFFFSVRDKDSARWAAKLNRLARRPDIVVIGLTGESRGQAERFMRRHKLAFTIGARSRSAKDFKIGRLPAIVRIRARERSRAQTIAVEELESLLPDWGEYGEEDISQLDEEWELKAFVDSDADGMRRAAALRKFWELYGTQDPEGVVELVDSRLPVETDPWARGALEYFRDIAQGTARSDHELAPSVEYGRAYRANPSAPMWAEVREYQEGQQGATPQELLEEYQRHLSGTPSDTLIRRLITREVSASRDHAEARRTLMEILASGEPDASIRLRAAGELGQVCEVGDLEVADFLESMAAVEPNILRTRPMMEFIAGYLRTGEWDRRLWEPRPW